MRDPLFLAVASLLSAHLFLVSSAFLPSATVGPKTQGILQPDAAGFRPLWAEPEKVADDDPTPLEEPIVESAPTPTPEKATPAQENFFVNLAGKASKAAAEALSSAARTAANAVSQAVQRQVDSTVNAVKAIPSRIADAAARKIDDVKQTVASIPSKVSEAAKAKADETKKSIAAVPGKIQQAAALQAKKTQDEIKAIPGKVATAAEAKATEIANEIKATPGKVAGATKKAVDQTVQNTKQAIEDTVDDTIDAVEKAVDEVASLPSKALDEIEDSISSFAGVERKRPSTPIPPKVPPKLDSVKAEPPRPSLSLPALEFPRPSVNIPKIDVPASIAPPNVGSPSTTAKPPASTTTSNALKSPAVSSKGSPGSEKAESRPSFSLSQLIPGKSEKEDPTKGDKTEKARRETEEMKLPSLPRISLGAVSQKSDAEKRESDKVKQAAKSAAAEKAKTQRLKDEARASALEAKKKMETEKRAQAAAAAKEKERQEALQKQAKEAALEAKKQAEAEKRARLAAAAEEKRQKAIMQQEAKKEAAEAKKKAEEERRSKLAAAAEERKQRLAEQQEKKKKALEEKKRALEEKRAVAAEAAEKRKQQRAEKKAALEAASNEKRKKLAELKEKQTKQAAKQTGEQSRSTFSLADLLGPAAAPTKAEAAGSEGVPVLSNWQRNSDGSIVGAISGSPNFKDGEVITTSPITGTAKEGSTVRSSSGSRYYLGRASSKPLFGSSAPRPTLPKNKTATKVGGLKKSPKKVDKVQVRPQARRIESRAVAIKEKKPLPKAPAGVPSIKGWRERRDGGITGRIYSSPNFSDGEQVETSKIVKGSIENGSVVQTSSGSRYYLSSEPATKPAGIVAALANLSSAKPGSTIQLTQQKREDDARKAKAALERAKPGATFSLFGLGAQQEKSSTPTKPRPQKSRAVSSRKLTKPAASRAPKGVATIKRWRQNQDKSITGLIYGSTSFGEGERVTTSPIVKGVVSNGEVVTTGSGSRYFLA